MSIWIILLILLLIMSFGGTGYGYYREAPYTGPLGAVGTLLLIALILWLLFGGGIAVTPPVVR